MKKRTIWDWNTPQQEASAKAKLIVQGLRVLMPGASCELDLSIYIQMGLGGGSGSNKMGNKSC